MRATRIALVYNGAPPARVFAGMRQRGMLRQVRFAAAGDAWRAIVSLCCARLTKEEFLGQLREVQAVVKVLVGVRAASSEERGAFRTMDRNLRRVGSDLLLLLVPSSPNNNTNNYSGQRSRRVGLIVEVAQQHPAPRLDELLPQVLLLNSKVTTRVYRLTPDAAAVGLMLVVVTSPRVRSLFGRGAQLAQAELLWGADLRLALGEARKWGSVFKQ